MVIAVLALVVLAGCTTIVTDDSEPDAEELVADALSMADREAAVTGERTVSFDDGNWSHTATERVWERSPAQTHSKVLSTSDDSGGSVGDRYVRNDSTIWVTDSDAGDVTAFDVGDPPTSPPLENYTIEYEGTDTVANRSAHVVTIEPSAETIDRHVGLVVGDTQYVYPLETSPTPVTEYEGGTLWIDTEHAHPLKIQETYTDVDGGTLAVSVTYETISFEDDVDADRFEPPFGDEDGVDDGGDADNESAVTEPEPEYTEFDTREAAAAELDFDVPTLSFPEEYERQEIAVDRWDGLQTYHEEYAVGGDWLFVSISEDDLRPDEPDRTAVGELNASVVSLEHATVVTWHCGDAGDDGLTYELSSSLEEDRLLERAEAIGCQ